MFSFVIYADETFHSVNSELRELPAVELSTLPLILKVQKDALFLSYFIVCLSFIFIPYSFLANKLGE
jgi:hypothetical protein